MIQRALLNWKSETNQIIISYYNEGGKENTISALDSAMRVT